MQTYQLIWLRLPFGEGWAIAHNNGELIAGEAMKEENFDECIEKKEIELNPVSPKIIFGIVEDFKRVLYRDGSLHPITISQLQTINLIDGVMGLWDD